jgi:dolichol-phosphate mannosyltransferase
MSQTSLAAPDAVPPEVRHGGERSLVSIVCPVYNEEQAVPLFYQRLRPIWDALAEHYDFELIFTNNRSSDGTLAVIRALREDDARVQVITLSRNFGYQGSLMSGIKHAKGDALVIIDVDGEDPPEMIPQFVAEWARGYDIVYGERHKRPELMLIQLARKAFYRITRAIADYDFVLDMAEFSIFDRHVRDCIQRHRSSFPFIRSDLGFVGFKRLGIPYERGVRVSGQSHYNLFAMTQFAIGGILSSSTFPLRFLVYLGLPLSLFDLGGIPFLFSQFGRRVFELLALINFAVLSLAAALLAIYLARTYKDGVGRPRYLVDWRLTTLNQNKPVRRGARAMDTAASG